MSTVDSVGATRAMRSRTLCMAGALPISRSAQSARRSGAMRLVAFDSGVALSDAEYRSLTVFFMAHPRGT